MGTLIGLKEMDLLKDRSCAFAISIWFWILKIYVSKLWLNWTIPENLNKGG